jgi:hypothetical protein
MHKITDLLYLGNIQASANSNLLKHHEITDIINCCEAENYFTGEFKYHNFNLLDDETENIEQYFETFSKILQNPNSIFFVHCMAGKSRSASFVLSYLISAHKHTLRSAYDMLQSIGAEIEPNISFWFQLENLEAKLTGARTMTALQYITEDISHMRNTTLSVDEINSIEKCVTEKQFHCKKSDIMNMLLHKEMEKWKFKTEEVIEID